jgi:hypothetical protein
MDSIQKQTLNIRTWILKHGLTKKHRLYIITWNKHKLETCSLLKKLQTQKPQIPLKHRNLETCIMF